MLVQLEPLFVERKTPPPEVPAKRLEPMQANEVTDVLVRPVLADLQLIPLLVERKIPPSRLAANRFVP
jgi:hypothetical protein